MICYAYMCMCTYIIKKIHNPNNWFFLINGYNSLLFPLNTGAKLEIYNLNFATQRQRDRSALLRSTDLS